MKNQKATLEILKAISHQARISIIETLETQPQSFSKLMLACGLNPNFDTGQFCYHLSELMQKGIVTKKEDRYRLTDFGQVIFKVLKMTESECSMFSKNVIKHEVEEVKKLKELTTRWGREEDLKKLRTREDRFVLNLKKYEDRIPPEKRMKADKFKEWTAKIPLPPLYLAEKDGKIVGELILDFRRQDIVELIKTEEEQIPRRMPSIEFVGALTFEEDRETVIKSMLDKFLAEAKENGVEVVRTYVDFEDQAYLNALKDSGFEKLVTQHLMQKIIK